MTTVKELKEELNKIPEDVDVYLVMGSHNLPLQTVGYRKEDGLFHKKGVYLDPF